MYTYMIYEHKIHNDSNMSLPTLLERLYRLGDINESVIY